MKRISLTLFIAGLLLGGLLVGLAVAGPPTTPNVNTTTINTYRMPYAPYQEELVINELDADTPGADTEEFIELYDGGEGNAPLDGLVVVVYNGGDDLSDYAFDLDGYTTNANGYFLLGNSGVTPTPDIVFANGALQNGADAAALYLGDAADFPNGTPVTNTNLIDAIVYDTSDPDDPGLLNVLLNPGQPQVNEDSGGNGSTNSNQRCPNGAGGQRNTGAYTQMGPTPGAANDCRPDLTVGKTGPAMALPGNFITYTITYAAASTGDAHDVVISDTLPNGVFYVSDDSGLTCPACALDATGTLTWDAVTVTFGSNLSFTLTGWVTANVPVPSTLINTISITTTDVELATDNNDDQWETYVSPLDLVVTKDGPAYALAGEQVVYTITVNNVGTVTAAELVVTDTLPVSTTYDTDNSGVFPDNPSAGIYIWELGDVLSSTITSFNLTVTVDSDAANGTVLTNEVQVGTSTAGDLPDNNTATHQATAYELRTIAEARQLSDGEIVAVEGYVNFPPGLLHDAGATRDEFMIQDAPLGTSGIDVYYSGAKFTPLNEGDKVLVIGELDEFNGKREIIPASPGDVYPDGSTATLAPVVTDTGAISETTEGVLVEIVGEVLSASSSSLTVDDGSGATTVYRDYDTGVSFGDVIAGDYVRVVGVGSQYDSSLPYTEGYQVIPRFQSDLTEFPRVLSTTPADDAAGVSVNTDVQAVFNLTVTNVNSTTFMLDGPLGAVTGAISYDSGSMTATFDPDDQLDFESTYTATLTQGIESLDGEPLLQEVEWSFTTGAPGLFVVKSAPASVNRGDLFTYTITVENETATDLSSLVITDAVPANTALAQVLDGGAETDGVISWASAVLSDSLSLEVRFIVTATGPTALASNDGYYAWASEWITRETGPRVDTAIVGGCPVSYTHVYDIQGSGDTTPYDGQDVTTCGVVVGVSSALGGVFIQDAMGDGDLATSDGIFVYRGYQGVGGVALGDLALVTGEATEYYDCTQISASGGSDVLDVLSSQYPLPAAASLDPPADRSAADVYLEALEGMLTDVPVDANVVGPTNAYGETYIVRADTGVSRLVLQTDPPDGYRMGIDSGISEPGEFKVGDVVGGARGPLHYTYDNWKIEQLEPLSEVSIPALPNWPSYPPAAANQFSVGAFNLLNFDGDDDAIKLSKITGTIEAMGAPLFLSLEEIAVEDCWHIDAYTVTGVMDDLLAGLADKGYDYDYLASDPDVGCHGVALLYDADRVMVEGWDTLQACSPYGSSSADYDPLWDACRDQGEYPLFSRRPVVAHGSIEYNGRWAAITVIANHFKSKSGSNNEERRLAQATLVAEYAAGLMDSGSPNVVVAGDLNDYVDSPPLDALYDTGALTNTFFTLPAEERYSYIYNGTSQVLDHILVSPALWDVLEGLTPLHVNADYPAAWENDDAVPYRVSDHDPLLATFGLPAPNLVITKTVLPSGDVPLGGVVTYEIILENDGDGPARGVVMSDVLPLGVTFGGWLDQGSASLQLPPADDTITWGPHNVLVGESYALRFTATVTSNTEYYGALIPNAASFDSVNASSGSDEASFSVVAQLTDVDLSGSTKVSSADGQVMPGDQIAYTITLSNSGAMDASAVVTDVLGNNYIVFDMGDLTESPAGTLTWSGTVTAGQEVVLQFVVLVLDQASLPFGQTTLDNTLQVYDGVNAPFDAPDASPPWVEIRGIYLPLVMFAFMP